MNDDVIMLQELRPTRADAIKNRNLLLATAERLFDEYGVEAVSMSAVAEAAGVGKGTLYRHFTSKTDLCLGLLDKDQRELQERTLDRLRADGDPYDDLCWFIEQVLEFVESHLKWLRVIGVGASSLEHPAHLWWRQTIRSLMERIGVSGDIDYKADVLYGLLNPHMQDFQREALGYSRERVRQGLIDTLNQLIA
ncbi:MAG: helix-turn-helix domain-containing protein [Chloroflexota bacterium]